MCILSHFQVGYEAKSLLVGKSVFDGSEEHVRIATATSKLRRMFPSTLFYVLEISTPYQRSAIWHKLCLLALHFDFSKGEELSYRNVKREVLLELSDVVESLPYDLLFVLCSLFFVM